MSQEMHWYLSAREDLLRGAISMESPMKLALLSDHTPDLEAHTVYGDVSGDEVTPHDAHPSGGVSVPGVLSRSGTSISWTAPAVVLHKLDAVFNVAVLYEADAPFRLVGLFAFRCGAHGPEQVTIQGHDLAVTVGFSSQTLVAHVQDPRIIYPVGYQRDIPVNMLLQSSAFQVRNGSDVHVESHWQLLYQGNPQIDWTTSEQLTTYQILPAFAEYIHLGELYHVRVRHKGGALGWSSWSREIPFYVAMESAPAVVYPVDGSIVDISAFTGFVSTPFNSIYNEVHTSSTWRIYADSEIVHASGPVGGANLTSYDFSHIWQSSGSECQAQVMHTGEESGDSPWSLPTAYTIKSAAAALRDCVIIGHNQGITVINNFGQVVDDGGMFDSVAGSNVSVTRIEDRHLAVMVRKSQYMFDMIIFNLETGARKEHRDITLDAPYYQNIRNNTFPIFWANNELFLVMGRIAYSSTNNVTPFNIETGELDYSRFWDNDRPSDCLTGIRANGSVAYFCTGGESSYMRNSVGRLNLESMSTDWCVHYTEGWTAVLGVEYCNDEVVIIRRREDVLAYNPTTGAHLRTVNLDPAPATWDASRNPAQIREHKGRLLSSRVPTRHTSDEFLFLSIDPITGQMDQSPTMYVDASKLSYDNIMNDRFVVDHRDIAYAFPNDSSAREVLVFNADTLAPIGTAEVWASPVGIRSVVPVKFEV